MSEGNQQGQTGTVSPEVFVHNLAKLYEEYGKAVSAFMEPREKGIAPAHAPAETQEVIGTLTKVAESWLSDPKRAVELQSLLWKNYLDIWGTAARRMTGDPGVDMAKPENTDRRFQSPDWSRNIFFDFCKQFYLATSDWAAQAVEQADGLDDHTRQKARFYVQQISAALSPSNFVLTNPELLNETLANNGANLVRGMQMLAEDIKSGKGNLKLRQTDTGQFALGENIAVTPGSVVFQNDLIQLLQYAPVTEQVFKKPLLIVPPWINKFYILDLNAEKSLIRWLVEQGHTVFCISWVNPDAPLRDKGFDAYMQEGILAAVKAVQEITGEPDINAVGYCVGGTLLAATQAWLAGQPQQPIASLSFLTAQVDFEFAGNLKLFMDEDQVAALENAMNGRGFLDSSYMASAFNMLRADDLIWPYFVNTYLRGQQPTAFDLLYWNSDSTRMTPANHSFYMRECYMKNALALGEMTLSGKALDLKKITCPVYELATKDDHIAPAKSVFKGLPSFGGPVTFVLSASGHIAGVVNPPSRGKYVYWTNDDINTTLDDWAKNAAEHKGSWWPHWQQWLEKINSEKVPARQPGSKNYPPLEAAPGSYVRVKE